jgi:hypothetical protein
MSESIDNLIKKYKILSKLRANGKITTITKKKLEIETNDYQFIKRWWYGDDRQKTIDALNELKNETVEVSDRVLDTKYMNIPSAELTSLEKRSYNTDCRKLHELSTEMINSLKGLIILKETYANDTTTQIEIDVVLNNMKEQSIKISEFLEKKLKEDDIMINPITDELVNFNYQQEQINTAGAINGINMHMPMPLNSNKYNQTKNYQSQINAPEARSMNNN